MKPSQLNKFTLGYVLAALWTSDPSPGQGDYMETGLPLVDSIPSYWMEQAIADCERFQAENAELLEQAEDDSRNGHDFWLTRNGHGTGFWDRDYSDEVGRGLQNACRTFGEAYLDWEELAQDETQA